MTSANQLYKESGAELPFKEWLKREQLRGKLDVHEDHFLNAGGDDDDKEPSAMDWVIPAVIGVAVGYAICHFMKKRS
tara:strand:+ start:635 stop:865 length:231 start_codon:yes stop_codon:yes gene_type:complete